MRNRLGLVLVLVSVSISVPISVSVLVSQRTMRNWCTDEPCSHNICRFDGCDTKNGSSPVWVQWDWFGILEGGNVGSRELSCIVCTALFHCRHASICDENCTVALTGWMKD
jgi:hypothetical protein